MSFPGSILIGQNEILQNTSYKVHPLGTRAYTRDGRVFRYARNGATALKPGLPVQGCVPLGGQMIKTGTTKPYANTTKVKLLTGASAAFTTRNSFADGYVSLDTSSTAKGAGVYAQIFSHTTQTATATGVVTFYFQDGNGLYNGTSNAGTTNCTVTITRNPYDKVVVKPSGAVTQLPVGIPVRPVAANAYFWLQTWGPCPVRCDAIANKIGTPVGVTTNTSARVAGVISTKGTSAASIASWTAMNYIIAQVGVAMQTGVSGRYTMVFLKLAP